MRKLFVTLDGQELAALGTLSQSERRELRAQAALLIRESLERRGLLPANCLPMRGNTATPNTDALGVNDAITR